MFKKNIEFHRGKVTEQLDVTITYIAKNESYKVAIGGRIDEGGYSEELSYFDRPNNARAEHPAFGIFKNVCGCLDSESFPEYLCACWYSKSAAAAAKAAKKLIKALERASQSDKRKLEQKRRADARKRAAAEARAERAKAALAAALEKQGLTPATPAAE